MEKERNADDHEKTWLSVSNYAMPKHRASKPAQSILRTGKFNEESLAEVGKNGNETLVEGKKSVKFRVSHQEKIYDPKGIASEHVVRAVDAIPVDDNAQEENLATQRSPEEYLLDVVQKKGARDLIEALKACTNIDPLFVDKTLNEQYDNIKRNLHDVKVKRRSQPSNAQLPEQENDLAAKRVIANVYINSFRAIEQVLTMKHWSCFEIRVLHIEVRKLPGMSRPGGTPMLHGSLRKVSGKLHDQKLVSLSWGRGV